MNQPRLRCVRCTMSPDRVRIVLVLCCGLLLDALPALAQAEEEKWLKGLYEQVGGDLAEGKPLVVQVHVPLCDSDIIPCGNERLGDGENPATNLYWSTSGGFKGWFKSAPGWKLVHRDSEHKGAVLERIIWRKRAAPSRTWRALGVDKPFEVYVVAFAWRGKEIARAIDAYVEDLYGSEKRIVELPGGTSIEAGGAAHVVAYVGHNGWMDIPPYDWKAAARRQGKRRKATIAVACLTADYLAQPITSERRVPLLMTTSLLFAGAHSFEGAVSAFARGEPLAAIRRAAATNHAKGQGKPFERVVGAFTNPSDRRWQRYLRSEP